MLLLDDRSAVECAFPKVQLRQVVPQRLNPRTTGGVDGTICVLSIGLDLANGKRATEHISRSRPCQCRAERAVWEREVTIVITLLYLIDTAYFFARHSAGLTCSILLMA